MALAPEKGDGVACFWIDPLRSYDEKKGGPGNSAAQAR
jgi:hypothetical protein